jgi:hypothetical protein
MYFGCTLVGYELNWSHVLGRLAFARRKPNEIAVYFENKYLVAMRGFHDDVGPNIPHDTIRRRPLNPLANRNWFTIVDPSSANELTPDLKARAEAGQLTFLEAMQCQPTLSSYFERVQTTINSLQFFERISDRFG